MSPKALDAPSDAERLSNLTRQQGKHLVWIGTQSMGYGKFRLNGKLQAPHRVAWFLKNGVWPSNKFRKGCDVPLCISTGCWYESRPLSPVDTVTYNRRVHLRRFYGITPEQYDEMFKTQNGKCAACGREQEDGARHVDRLQVDHDHSTGAVRGLLCSTCNRALGFLSDSPTRVEQLLTYIRKFSA